MRGLGLYQLLLVLALACLLFADFGRVKVIVNKIKKYTLKFKQKK